MSNMIGGDQVLPINEIIQGDCLEVMQSFPDKSVDMILADLPYGTTACSWDSIIPLEPLWKQYKRIIKESGAIVLTASQPFTTKLISSNIEWLRYCWVWDKVRPSGFQIAKYRPMMRHEDVCVFSKNPPNYNPIMEMREEKIKRRVYSSSDSSPLKYSDGKLREYDKKYPQSIIKFNKPHKYNHPTQKPVSLFEYLIKTYTNEGDLVLDNCIGSGTTAVACVNTNRKYIGIEKDPEYCKIARERVKRAESKKKLFYV